MSPAGIVEIIIYDAPAASKDGCGCSCGHHHGSGGHGDHGPDAFEKISMEMQAKALALTLEREFPGRVRVEYIDVLKDCRGPDLPQTRLLCSRAYPSPLVYVNGRGRFAGALPVERLREEVENLLTGRTA
jgi:hypothetical protein